VKPRKVTVPGSLAVPIVGDAAIIAKKLADGRLLPVLILDTRSRPEVAELIRVHEYLPPGDVRSQWAVSRDSDDLVMLHLSFTHPVEVEVLLVFSIERQAILVEALLRGGGVWLQAGLPGDRLATTPDAHRLLVEVPEMNFRQPWEEALNERMTRVMARRLGVSKKKARPAAALAISQMQELASRRWPT